MCMGGFFLVFGMTTGIAYLGLVTALTIDNQLTVIKNDCYDRLAIGHRLNSKDIYKTYEYNTLEECEAECTKLEMGCKSFSFGIGIKGNGTCQLSADHVKETGDLKPIGTIDDTEYDLYIKKIGCSLVIDKTPHDKLPTDYPDPGSRPTDAVSRPTSDSGDHYPLQNGYPRPPYASSYPSEGYLPPDSNVHHVQTLVSVASGPNSYLHPIHDILVGDGPYSYGKPHEPPRPSGCCEKNKECCAPSNLPPFRPELFNRPYNEPRPPYRPGDLDGPDSSYDRPSRPSYPNDRPYDIPDRPDSSYDRPDPAYDRPKPPYDRPDSSYDRPDPDPPYQRPYRPSKDQDIPYDMRRWDGRPHGDYDRPSKRPFRPGGGGDDSDRGGYDSFKPGRPYDKGYEPPRKPFRPDKDLYDPLPNSVYYERPLPPKYGSVIPHPDYYNKRPLLDYPEDDVYERPLKKPFYDRPSYPEGPGYHYDKPSRPSYEDNRPGGDSNNGYHYDKPSGSSYGDNRPGGADSQYDQPPKPSYEDNRPEGDLNNGYQYDKPPKIPSDSQSYGDGKPGDDGGSPNSGYNNDQPNKPLPDSNGKPMDESYPESPPPSGDSGYGNGPTKGKPNADPDNPNGGYGYGKPNGQKVSYGEKGSIISTSIGPHGEQITSIITELKDTCFRRVLAGKRAARRCVRRSLSCETVEQCQRECADERYFICEGFNYRYDPSGRGKGDCELLDIPLSQLDISRDLYPDRDYDYYERDRNAASSNCKQWPSRGGSYPPRRGGGYGSFDYDYNYYGDYIDRRYDGKRPPGYKDDRRPSSHGSSLRRPGDRWTEDDDSRYRPLRPLRPEYDYDRPSGNRRGDFSYHHSHSQDYENSRRYYHERDRYDYQGNHGIHYLPAHYHKPSFETDGFKTYEPYLPPKRFYDQPPRRYEENRYGWGSYGNFGHQDSYFGYKYQHNNRNRFDFDRKNYYLPPSTDAPKDWGLYGGTYGNGGSYYHHNTHGNKQSYDYWGFHKYDAPSPSRGDGYLPKHPPQSSYLPAPNLPGINYLPKPQGEGFRPLGGSYLPKPPGGSYLPDKPGAHVSHFGYGSGFISSDHFDNSILPAEPRRPPKYDFIRDECSLRSAAGFRLHKGIVKKFYAVPNIYECELLCYREKDFPCTSYAFRYTISLAAPTDNCYLSNRDYKELDYYTDLEPDRDFDIYTMNNKGRCEAPIIHGRDNSECFWRVRSGQRLAHKVVRDSLTAKSIVQCQLECLRSTRFTCRAFSYRYGSPIIGGVIDNCQLTDWPYFELDPRSHFVPEPGFEVYERGSFGHGCEPDHFGIRNKHRKTEGTKVDQLCYIGFGSPARLLPQATKKALYVSTELECKAECSKLREGTLFQCMSFSYRSDGPKGASNCYLSDILQRDLLPNVDYLHDPDYWLFAWDNYSPECLRLANEPVHGDRNKDSGLEERHGYDIFHALDTWRVYSVSGWPCRRGSLCQENREAGFWFCELDGGGKDSWDYCCRPDHQCGASDGYRYQWCYVGPAKTQWRKCSDRYYPYIHDIVGKVDISKLYLPPPQRPSWRPPPYRPGGRPDRPPGVPFDPPPTPSLDEYEKLFENDFLDPPKPGGFIQARHWPVSYLHKEMPPNNTDSEPRLMRMEKDANPKYAAIQNLINVIKNNDLKNVQYHISNESNNADDVLFVKIPLPTNFSREESHSSKNSVRSNTTVSLEPVYSDDDINFQSKRSHKSLTLISTRQNDDQKQSSYRFESDTYRTTPVYRRGFVTRTNITQGRLAF